MAIIALSGKSGSGKDAFAKYVCERGYERVAFADKLKTAAQHIFGLSHEQTHGALKNTLDAYWGTTPRDIMQRLGTEALRHAFGPNIWIRAMLRDLDPAKNYVVTDMRFRSEAEAMVQAGAAMIRIERPDNPNALTGAAAEHPSETELDTWTAWDRIIVNCSDLPHLWAMAVVTADEYRATPFVPREPAHVPARKPMLVCPRCPHKFRYELVNCPNCGARGES